MMHQKAVERYFGQKPTTFRNTELIYSDTIGALVADMGYTTLLTEEHVTYLDGKVLITYTLTL